MILVSLVGNQPGAVAVTTNTLCDLPGVGLSRVILLPTSKTLTCALKLKELFERWKLETRIIKVDISVLSNSESLLPTPQEAIRCILSEHDNVLVYFDISPGLNFHLAAIAQQIGTRIEQSRMHPLYSSDTYLHDLANNDKHELKDIGLHELLALYDLESEIDKVYSNGICQGVRLKNENDLVLELDFCCEYRGNMLGVKRISGQDRRQLNDESRRLLALIRDPRMLNHLVPRIFVITPDKWIRKRFLACGVDVLREDRQDLVKKNKKQLKIILEGIKVPEPGSRTFSEDALLSRSIKTLTGQGVPHPGAPNPDLLVCMGNDPAATIQSIMAHQPRTCYLAYDKETPYVKELTGRLCLASRMMPVNQLVPVQTDILGSNLKNWQSPASNNIASDELLLNVSPGTKAQCWNLSSANKGSIFTLINRDKRSSPLFGTHYFPYTRIPVKLQAEICGGTLSQKGTALEDLLFDKPWLELMLEAVKETLIKKQHISLQSLEDSQHGPRVQTQLLENDQIKITVNDGQKSHEKTCRGKDINQGFWLEPVVAYGLWRAGGDDIWDMHLNLGWSWDQFANESSEAYFHSELDVGINWKGVFLGVSCKQGYHGNNHAEELERARTEVIGVTRYGLGRLSLPVLVGPKVSDASKDPQDSLLELSIEDFLDPEDINKRVNSFIKSQSTT